MYDDYGYGDEDYGYGGDDYRGDDYGYRDDDYNRDDDYGYGGEEKDYDYDDGFRDMQEPEVIGSYMDIERVGAARIDSICNNLTSEIEGKDNRRFNMMHGSDKDKFIYEFCRFLSDNSNVFDFDDDRKQVEFMIQHIPMIKYKNPITYILGCYLYFSDNDKDAYTLIRPFLEPSKNITIYEVIKYNNFIDRVLSNIR
jgi:hypothetical protein